MRRFSRVAFVALGGLILAAIPAYSATPTVGEGMLHVIVHTSRGEPANDASVWVGTTLGGRRRLTMHHTGAMGHTSFVLNSGLVTVHARGAGGHHGTSTTFVSAGRESSMMITLHGGDWGGWGWGWGGVGPHLGLGRYGYTMSNAAVQRRILGARFLHRTTQASVKARAAVRAAARAMPHTAAVPKHSR